MSDHEYDYQVEAAEEAYRKRIEADFRRDYGDEIADEISTGEIVESVLNAHDAWIDPTLKSITKAKQRLAGGEFEEAVFHAARALDGYANNVFVSPSIAALAARMKRFVPQALSFKDRDFFRIATGLGGYAASLKHAVSVVALSAEDAEKAFLPFTKIRPDGGRGLWFERDRAFHAPVAINGDKAGALVAAVEEAINAVLSVVQARLDERLRDAERKEFSPGRVEILNLLSIYYDVAPNIGLHWQELQFLSWDASHEAYDAIRSLIAEGHVERVSIDREGREVGEETHGYDGHRLTTSGRAYFEQRAKAKLSDHAKRLGPLLSELASEKKARLVEDN